MIRIGSQPLIKNNVMISSPQQQTTPTPSRHHLLKQGSLSTNSSGSPDSLSRFGAKFNYEGNDVTYARMTSDPSMAALIGCPKTTRSQSMVPYVEDDLPVINK